MQTANEPYLMEEQGWTVRVQPPRAMQSAGSPRVILLLHGLLGNETVMWIFARSIPNDYWIFAPRAPVQIEPNGFSWLPRGEGWPGLSHFRQAASDLIEAFKCWSEKAGAPANSFDVMGFSQGAAMAYAAAAYFPQHVNRILALAGFLPQDSQVTGLYANLRGKRVYISHGSQDETIPVHEARQAVKILQSVGADVTYCESETGHKMSAACLRGLGEFFR